MFNSFLQSESFFDKRVRTCVCLARTIGLVAQICNLLYRRFVIGTAPENSSVLAGANALQNAILRYRRLQICATLDRSTHILL